jgi:hypothetical protein
MAKLVIGCECTNTGNLGLPQEYCKNGVIIGFSLQNRYNSTGAANVIDLNVSAITTAWSAKITATDKKIRVNPLMGLRQYAEQNADAVYVSDNQAIDEFVRDGDRKFTIEKWNVPSLLSKKINAWRCIEKVIYFYTEKGILGLRNGNNFTGIPLSVLHAKDEKETGDQPSKCMINGQLAREVEAGDFWFVPYEDFNTTKAAQVGFADVNITVSTAAVDGGTNTSVGLKMRSNFGNGLVYTTDVLGLVLADLVIYNVTTATAITGVSLTENEGVAYTLTFPSQTTADVIRISVNATGQQPYLEGKIEIAQPA